MAPCYQKVLYQGKVTKISYVARKEWEEEENVIGESERQREAVGMQHLTMKGTSRRKVSISKVQFLGSRS